MVQAPVPNSVLLVCNGLINGKPWTNVIGARSGADGAGGGVFLDQAMATALGGAVRGAYGTAAPTLVNKWSLQAVLIFDLQTAIAPSYDSGIAPLLGAATGEMVPPHIAACVTHRTNFRGRSYRGRTYIAGFTESQNDVNGQISTGARTVAETIFSDLRTRLAAIVGPDWRQAVVSRKLALSHTVISSRCDADWDHQDRRKR